MTQQEFQARRGSSRAWWPIAAAIFGLGATIVLLYAVKANEYAQIRQVTNVAAVAIKGDIEEDIVTRLLTHVDFGGMWRFEGKPSQRAFAQKAKIYLKRNPGFYAAVWADSSFQVRWTALSEGLDAYPGDALQSAGTLKPVMEAAASGNSEARLSPAVRLPGGRDARWAVLPVYAGQRLQGFVMVLFEQKEALDDLLQEMSGMGYGITVWEGNREIYRLWDGSTAYEKKWGQDVELKVAGVVWRINICPKPELLAAMQSPLSTLVLSFGGSLTLLLVLTVYFAQTARRKSHYAEYSASLLRATLESTADGLLALDRQGNVLTYNQKLVDMWHIQRFVLASRNGGEVLKSCLDQAKNPQGFQQRIQELQDNPEAQSSDVLEFEDGRVVECCSQPEHLGGSIVGRVWNFRDISERKRLEQQLRQAQKMEAVGRLAGGIAHDFNNILGVIIGYAELVLPRLPEGAALRSDAEQILQAAKRGTGLTRQLLTLSRRQVLQPEVVDLNVVVSGMGKLLRRLISEDIELWMVLHPALARVQADIGQIEQVVMNLVLNARDAMPDGGKLTLSTANVEVAAGYARQEGLAAGQYVLMAVSDTGCGMSAETRSRLFEPFFTTKEQGKGTGLGLATVYGIITQSGGHIHVDSEPGRGSTFKIYLPQVEQAKAGPRQPGIPAEVVAGSETILLAENEPGMRRLLSLALRTRGYKVLEASNGLEALQAAERHSGPIDLVLTDMLMPQMRGGELAAKVSAQRPEAKVLYMSGYSEDVFQTDASHLLLRKPFTLDNLLQRVQERLQS